MALTLEKAARQALEAWRTSSYGQASHHKAMVLGMTTLSEALEQTSQDAEDAARLDWLLWNLPGDALRYVVGELSDTSDAAEFRASIDAARTKGEKQ